MKETKRGLSEEFMKALKEGGVLNPLLKKVKRDNALCLQIRNNYINVYYKGGSMMRVEALVEKGGYSIFSDKSYLKGVELPKKIDAHGRNDVLQWVNNMHLIKSNMDVKSKAEREFQQLVARENNFSVVSNETDYFITDIEYLDSENKEGRFDMIGIRWDSTGVSRKSGENCKLVIIEMKYGDGAVSGSSGVVKHLSDVDKFCGIELNISSLKATSIKVFSQLRELGLVKFSSSGNKNEITSLSDEKPEYIYLFANHKPANNGLSNELKKLPEAKHVDLKFATSSFMGYGLYSDCMLERTSFTGLLRW